jgi:hypothetical protein
LIEPVIEQSGLRRVINQWLKNDGFVSTIDELIGCNLQATFSNWRHLICQALLAALQTFAHDQLSIDGRPQH